MKTADGTARVIGSVGSSSSGPEPIVPSSAGGQAEPCTVFVPDDAHEAFAGLDLQRRAAGLISERDQGTLTVGEVWRRHHLSCPGRHELGSYLLGASDEGASEYIRFHLDTIGCRTCQANIEDLRQAQATTPETIERRQRIFASSVSRLKRDQK